MSGNALHTPQPDVPGGDAPAPPPQGAPARAGGGQVIAFPCADPLDADSRGRPTLRIVPDDTAERRRLRVSGVFDVAGVAEVCAIIGRECALGNHEIWLDLDEVSETDCEVLAELGRVQRQLCERKAKLVVTGLHASALR